MSLPPGAPVGADQARIILSPPEIVNVALNSPPMSRPNTGQALTGKQEHYLKRELIAEQVAREIGELSTPTALQRFGAPFRSPLGEVTPLESELPILRYIFVHHVRQFPFLDKAREQEFWQDKLQTFLESFANKNISSSEDRLEDTKRRKLARKCQTLVELLMVSGIPTSSGFEERIRFADLEVVDRDAIDTGVLHNIPEGNYINGIDVNVAGVRMVQIKRNIRYHSYAEFILRVKRQDALEYYISHFYSDFESLHQTLQHEFPGKVLPSLPRKSKADMSMDPSHLGDDNERNEGATHRGEDDELSSTSSISTTGTSSSQHEKLKASKNHQRRGSRLVSADGKLSPLPIRSRKGSKDAGENVVFPRETLRVSLRAFIRALLQNPQIANSKAMQEFLNQPSTSLRDEDVEDVDRRRRLDQKRVVEQAQFYEVARQRASELNVYMEHFRREVIEENGLTNLFREIKEKKSIRDLSIRYQKFAEWLRIEVAAIIYHLFLAEDNSHELFLQARRIHSLVPYSVLKNILKVANPTLVMTSILNVFLAQPFGSRSLLQRIMGASLGEGVAALQRSIDSLLAKIEDQTFIDKVKNYTNQDEKTKLQLRQDAAEEQVDLMVVILRSELTGPPLSDKQIGYAFNAYVAFNNAVEGVDSELKHGAMQFSYLKQLLKLYMRQRDKVMMLELVEEPVTLQLFRDLFTIFYEPLIRVYKSANVYNSVTDFSDFMDDMIRVVQHCREETLSADPNQTVQTFIDLCARHEDKFYEFVHEVHMHDNGLFTELMGWIEEFLTFLRQGPAGHGKLDMNGLFENAVADGLVNRDKVIAEVNDLIAWQRARKKWRTDKTRQKMAAEGGGSDVAAGEDDYPGVSAFTAKDFGLHDMDLEDMTYDDNSSEEYDEEADDDLDPIAAERARRARAESRLRRHAGEPEKPPISEVKKLEGRFLLMLRKILAG